MLQVPPLSLYVHLPWCAKKCPYCDFNAHALRGRLPEKAYIDQLLKDFLQDLPRVQGREIISLFFGGGTPSLFSPEAFNDLLSTLRTYLPFSPEIEITLEANPGTMEKKMARGSFLAYRQAGINRISLGVQSFSSPQLALLGRIHDAEAAVSALEEIQNAGFKNYNVDLMHGLPEQSVETAIADLETAIHFGVPHISWYQLTLEPHTLFAVRPPVLPSEDVLAAIEASGFECLQKAGYARYEISAFAKSEAQQSVHNRNYWTFGDYLGIGAGAHAKITDLETQSIHRCFKLKHPKAYLAANTTFIQEAHVLKPESLPLEFMLNALRLSAGVSITLFESRTGLSWSGLQGRIQQGIDRDLLEYREGKRLIAATPLGLRFLNELLLIFS